MTPSGSERELQELREEVRGWLVDAKYGVITEGELVARADSLIAELAEPPDYLIAVSLGESLAQVPRLDMVKERIDARDLGLFAGRLLARLEAGEMDGEAIAAVCAKVAWPRDERAQNAWLSFTNITDRKDLIEQGVCDDLKYEDFLRAELKRAAEFAAE